MEKTQLNESALHGPSTLVCVSDEKESENAIVFACLRGHRRKNHVTLLHVLEPTEFQGLASITDAIREEQEEHAEKIMQHAHHIAIQNGMEHPSMLIRQNSLANGIISAIEENPNINLVVLAVAKDSHRAPKLMEALTEEIGKGIQVPLVVVPGSLTREQVEAIY